MYSTVALAWGHAAETAKKLDATFPVAKRIRIIPLLATKSFTALTSVSNLTVNTLEVGLGTGAGVTLGEGSSFFEHAAAKQETHAAAKPPETVVKNSVLFIFLIG
jgi:hypothetical protein